MNTVYEEVTTKIVEALERGTVPWRKAWYAPPYERGKQEAIPGD